MADGQGACGNLTGWNDPLADPGLVPLEEVFEADQQRAHEKGTVAAPVVESPELQSPPPSLWGWFRKAGIARDWFTPAEQEIMRLVYRRHTLALGWNTARDRDRAIRDSLPLYPGKLARTGRFSCRTYSAAIALAIETGFLRVVATGRGRERFVCSGWWHGPEAESENLASLRECFARLRGLRPCRPRKPRGKGAQQPRNDPAMTPQ